MLCPKCGVETNQFQYSKEMNKYGHKILVCRLCHFWENERRGEFVVAGLIFATGYALLKMF